MNSTAKTALSRRGKIVFLFIILTPLVIALTGGAMLYFWSNKNAHLPTLAPGTNEGKPSPTQ
jgi:hypothetical protein